MKVEARPENPVTNEACKAATGKTIDEWIAEVEARPEIAGKRRDSIQWMYEAMGTKGDVWWPTTVWCEMDRRAGKVQKDGRLEGYHLCATKTINAPIARVYQAFLGERLAQWFQDDPEVAPDGSFADRAGNRATATRVRENKDLRYTWVTAGFQEPTEVEVVLTDNKGRTGLVVNHKRIQTREEADGLRRAWGEALDRLKRLAESE